MSEYEQPVMELCGGGVLAGVAPPALELERRGRGSRSLRRRRSGRSLVDERAVVGRRPPAARHRGPRVVDEARVEARHHCAAHHCHEHRELHQTRQLQQRS